jgi:hypothetical protein
MLIAIVAVLSAAVPMTETAFAQTPSPVECVTYPSDSPWQTIEVHLVKDDCRINPYAGDVGIPRLLTWSGGKAYWDVCNKCGAPVDVRLSNSAPHNLSALFDRFSPMIDASESSTATKIPTGQHPAFSGDATTNEDVLDIGNKYSIAVKFSSEGVGGWDEFDPELQIDDFRPQAPLIPWIGGSRLGVLAGLLGLLLGFAFGWWLARRRNTLGSQPSA